MVTDPDQKINGFIRELINQCGIQICRKHIFHQYLPAPHIATNLRQNCGAVYVFTTQPNSKCQAGSNRALKVGMVNPRSNARFQYQHYSGSANSTLSGAIQNNCILWNIIGYSEDIKDTGEWIKNYLDRDDFFVEYHKEQKAIIKLFEIYLKAQLGPIYEGSLLKNRRTTGST